MLFRRIAEHVKAQNWTAVAIDFVIVVVGILIAFQITNWNTNQQALQQERQVLEQLYEQLGTFISDTETVIVAQQANNDASVDFLLAIQRAEKPVDSDAFEKLLVKANSLEWAGTKPTALVELVSSGRLSNLSSPALRTSLTTFYQAYVEHEQVAAVTLALITSPQNHYHKVVTMDPREVGKVTSIDWEKISDLRAEIQNNQIGKRIIVRQMQDLRDQAVAIQADIKEIQ